ncbi:hypothetical protein LY13_005099 [Prauserella aidingensis]|nr:hypothetical protein [Prauserella aidingensis]
MQSSHLLAEECAAGGQVRRNGTGWECTTIDSGDTAEPGTISNSGGDQPYGFNTGANEAEETAEGGHRLFVTSGRGVTYDIPKGWSQRIADNDKGLIFQRPAAVGNADMIRIMEPTTRYPRGYVRVHNSHGQPVDVFGKPGSKPATHISQDYIGPWPAWPQ